MQSNNSKKTFRPETEEKGRKRNSQKKQAAAAGVAMTAIAVILLGAGIGYSVQRAGKTESISLEEMQNSVSSALKGEMESAATSLEQLNQNIADNQKKLDEVNAQLAQREESLLQVETIQHRLEENASGMTGKVTDLEKTTHTKVNEIRTDMESIHTDVTKTLEEISRIMQEMDAQKKQDNTDHKESITEINRINESVQSVNQTVSKLEDRLNTSYENLKNLVQEVRTTEEKNRELWTQEQTQLTEQQKQLLKEVEESRQETIRSLALVESNLKNMLESDMVQITAAFGSLTAELQTRVQELSALLENRMNRVDQNLSGLDKNVTGLGNNISGLNENVNGLNENVDGVGKNVESLFTRIGELDNGMQTNLTTLQQTFAKQFGDLNVSAGQNTEELKSYLEELNNGLKQDMNQVFTSVSNGKKKLASALLTKGVSTNEDATFAQLAEAILNIDQKLVIGVEEIPGTIRYQYHYHVDASGNQPHTEKSDTAGGCYTGTHGHVHSVEDGCYKEESYHIHRDDCSGYPVWVDWAPGVEPYWGFIYTCGEPANATRRVLICSKQAGSTDYYVPSCGLADGQIIGAEILYDQAHAQVKAQEEQQCRDELVRLALSMQPALGSNTSETEQIGTDADNIPPAPEQIAAEAERKRQEEAAAEAERRQESAGEVKTEADRRQESEGEAAADADRRQEAGGASKSDSSTDNVGTSKGADVDRREESADTPKSDGSTENVNTTAMPATDSQKISEASEN
ncbi:hypothetical protein [Gallintestinimicrobium sp.]|uniref:hypothetical protein n=1 Tax=Gallintestinimicrobium sp. TaxID=2981655 RepID=UPI00307C5F8C